jgi:hypothetical protein
MAVLVLCGNGLPKSMLEGANPDCDYFLKERRQLIALKVEAWFEAL